MSDVMSIRRKLIIQGVLTDGRCKVLVVWEDGDWKVEIFASEAHARKFADDNQMEVTNNAHD